MVNVFRQHSGVDASFDQSPGTCAVGNGSGADG